MKVWFVVVFLSISALASAQDVINPATIEVVGGSPNVLNWRVTGSITRVTLWPGNFEVIDDTHWPGKTPPGWDGPINRTLWVVRMSDGQWRTTGSLEFWDGRTQTQSPLSSALQDWWYYAPEIGQPQPGELIGLFMAAGDQRRKDMRTVEERTNIVAFRVPSNDTGSFDFVSTPPQTPEPPHKFEPLPPPPQPIIVPPPDLSGVFARLDELGQQLANHEMADAEREERLKAVINEPAFIMKFFGNKYVQEVLVAAGTFFTTYRMMK